MKIKSVVVVIEGEDILNGQKYDNRMEIDWDDFIYLLCRDIDKGKAGWSKEKLNELRERLGE